MKQRSVVAVARGLPVVSAGCTLIYEGAVYGVAGLVVGVLAFAATFGVLGMVRSWRQA